MPIVLNFSETNTILVNLIPLRWLSVRQFQNHYIRTIDNPMNSSYIRISILRFRSAYQIDDT